MKRFFVFLIALMTAITVKAQKPSGNEADVAQIKSVIQTAYVEGLQNEGDTLKINKGFHPGFEMLIQTKEGDLKKYPLALWKQNIKSSLFSGQLPRKPADRISVKYLFVDVTGNSAVAKFEFYTGNKLTFIDYLSLYKFPDGWKIVSKIFSKV